MQVESGYKEPAAIYTLDTCSGLTKWAHDLRTTEPPSGRNGINSAFVALHAWRSQWRNAGRQKSHTAIHGAMNGADFRTRHATVWC